MKNNSTYQLQNYHWRSFLTFVGPLAVLALYTFTCRAFLARPPVNDVVDTVYPGARWIYFVWFVIIIFTLDWSRVGLANIEAAALMHPRLAPMTAISLMWHTDTKWANPVWWLRAIHVGLTRCFRRGTTAGTQPMCAPDKMWILLSLTTMIIYCALPLSGLTMEITDVLTYTNQPAKIYGPNDTSFNFRSTLPT
ncbi:hypothetical protein H2198_004601 [Neophaeococcomyces mojaviensis]|uniref:Uncharacterized protein n=1 Tax=Neophaeococcomyces mojaviensis TaxID=3383035 RepID=A0ACC3A8K7_9EURO|nr:hypothetical protein H2198_004601 [Knufia sp. JES_112]